jgi:hypothetical protein
MPGKRGKFRKNNQYIHVTNRGLWVSLEDPLPQDPLSTGQQCALCDHSWHRKGPILWSPLLQNLLSPWALEWRSWGMELTEPDLDVRG